MLIERIYHDLWASDLVQSQYDFDRSYLKRPTGHFGYLKAARSEPSIDTLWRLYLSLEHKGQDVWDETEAKDILDGLAGVVWEELQELVDIDEDQAA